MPLNYASSSCCPPVAQVTPILSVSPGGGGPTCWPGPGISVPSTAPSEVSSGQSVLQQLSLSLSAWRCLKPKPELGSW